MAAAWSFKNAKRGNVFSGLFILLQSHGDLPLFQFDDTIVFQSCNRTVDRLYSDPDLLVQFLSCKRHGNLSFLADAVCIGIAGQKIKEKEMGRIKKFCPAVVGGAVEFESDFAGHKS